MAQVISDINGQFSGFQVLHPLIQACTDVALRAGFTGSCSSNLAIFENFLGILFSFFTSSNNNFLYLCLEIGDKFFSICDFVTHKSWVYYRLRAFKG